MRKAILINKTVVMITLLISTIILFVVYYKISNILKDKDKVELCRNSLILFSYSKNTPYTTKIKCPKSEIKFTMDEFKNHEIPKKLANELKECNYKTGENKFDLSKGLFKVKRICIICSYIIFDDDLKELNKKFDIYNYLKHVKMNDKETYLDYLSKNRGINYNEDKTININGKEVPLISDIKSSKEYYIVYREALNKEASDSYVMLIPKEYINLLRCDLIFS